MMKWSKHSIAFNPLNSELMSEMIARGLRHMILRPLPIFRVDGA